MWALDAIVAYGDKSTARNLADSLRDVFRSVQVVNSADELRSAIAQKPALLVITDLETIDFKEVAQLQREFGLAIVCTHRIPDEAMWAEALGHGAIDCCHTSDVNAIIQAVSRNIVSTRLHAA